MKKIAIVGAGHRCYTSFAKPLWEQYSDKVEIVGVCDFNIKRCEYFQKTLNPKMGIYTDFEKMIEETNPTAILITTQDSAHHDYIIRAMKKGCDVYCEKPITIDQEKCFAIREAEKEYGKKVTVTFNCRFMPYFIKLKETVSSGIVGKLLSINYEYNLATEHGGDYFKRWHRHMNASGGMLVHKSTHHFDIINWLLEDDPLCVNAQGARLFFGNAQKAKGERCSTCNYSSKCCAYADFSKEEHMDGLYFSTENEDGYIRDRCAFSDDTDIYDTMSVTVKYKKGALLTYSLTLYSVDEGFVIDIVGEHGRIEAPMLFEAPENIITIKLRDGTTKKVVVPAETGTHEGADERMLEKLFGEKTDDPLCQCADSFDGFKSAMIGICANKSIKENLQINIDKVLEQLK